MTKLTSPVSRETKRKFSQRNVIVTIAPCGNQDEALIGMRLKGTRTQYVAAVSSLYQVMALWHGNKEKNARREARKHGIPWKTALKTFNRENLL